MRRMFSEKQIKKMIQEAPAEILEAIKNQDVKVKTIEQSEANFTGEITSFVNTSGGTSNLIYGRVQQINGELHIVFIGSIANETESAITFYGTNEVSVTLPEEIADKIYDMAGNKVTTSDTNIRISGSHAYGARDTGSDMSKYYSDVVFIVKHNGANKISLTFSRPNQISIPAGETAYFEGRVSLDLL